MRLYLANSTAGGHARRHGKKGKKERKMGRCIPWPLAAFPTSISGEHEQGRPRLQREERGKNKREDGWSSSWTSLEEGWGDLKDGGEVESFPNLTSSPMKSHESWESSAFLFFVPWACFEICVKNLGDHILSPL